MEATTPSWSGSDLTMPICQPDLEGWPLRPCLLPRFAGISVVGQKDKKKRPSPKDINLLADRIVGDATEEEQEIAEPPTSEKHAGAVELQRFA